MPESMTPKQKRFFGAIKGGAIKKKGISSEKAGDWLKEASDRPAIDEDEPSDSAKKSKKAKSESDETPEDEKKESAATQKKEAEEGTEEHPESNPFMTNNKHGLKKVAKANKMKAMYSKAGNK